MFPILRRIWRDIVKNVVTSSYISTRYSCRILMKLEFSRQLFEKSSVIKFHQIPSSGSRVVLCRQADITKPIVAFRNFVNAPNNKQIQSSELSDNKHCIDGTTIAFFTTEGRICALTVSYCNCLYWPCLLRSKMLCAAKTRICT